VLCSCGPELRSPAPFVHDEAKLRVGGLVGAASWWVKIGLARQVTCPRAGVVWLVRADESVHVCRDLRRLDDERLPGE
jgi:hypothetical protein